MIQWWLIRLNREIEHDVWSWVKSIYDEQLNMTIEEITDADDVLGYETKNYQAILKFKRWVPILALCKSVVGLNTQMHSF